MSITTSFKKIGIITDNRSDFLHVQSVLNATYPDLEIVQVCKLHITPLLDKYIAFAPGSWTTHGMDSLFAEIKASGATIDVMDNITVAYRL
jgi:hypothetical protein